MKRVFSFFMITFFMFIAVEVFNAEDLSIKSHQDLTYTFTADALASPRTVASQPQATISPSSTVDPTTILLLGSGLIGLAGFGRKKVNK